ncbi:hypothetical protein HBE96_20400 [Clostridium sp. P21]|uniref:Pyruvate kinase C-terminal domain-containing protein n=1 Tax=Clostridium muellerianum TaxID=2716538 RepID=A0A7Y0EK49_9CLOT|nr:pyruvate kinase alpha/beta domain-containing protein [Clostridium muellerianum]NMM64955.1 hypothetical protein [Clostridium muellerianum]
MEVKTVYFENVKDDNTIETFKLAEERLRVLGIKKLVLASTTGSTAKRAMYFFKDKGVQLIVIPHQYDFNRKENAFPKELVKTLKENGHEVHFGTMLFHTDKLYSSNVPMIIANFLRRFCEGVKVCYEIVLMASDACLLTNGEKVIAVAGTGKGSDTALVMQAASTRNLEKLRVNEIICKPLNSYELQK